MRHSFIQARPKHLMSWEIKILLLFFFGIFVLLSLTYSYLKVEIYVFQKETQVAQEEKVSFQKATDRMQKRIDYIKIQSNRAKLIFTDNALLCDSIRNLFDIIPDKITLSKAMLEKNSLILYGKTPTKEVYQFRLLAPLRAIFDRSFTSYFQQKNGWINFVSSNYIDTESVPKELKQ